VSAKRLKLRGHFSGECDARKGADSDLLLNAGLRKSNTWNVGGKRERGGDERELAKGSG